MTRAADIEVRLMIILCIQKVTTDMSLNVRFWPKADACQVVYSAAGNDPKQPVIKWIISANTCRL